MGKGPHSLKNRFIMSRDAERLQQHKNNKAHVPSYLAVSLKLGHPVLTPSSRSLAKWFRTPIHMRNRVKCLYC